jgi:hypothetical protein
MLRAILATIFSTCLVIVLATAACGPARSADLGEVAPVRYWHAEHHRIVLPPERHAIELVRPPYSGNFIINRAHFTAETTACLGWTAGDQIVLRSGDWHGYCVDAVFYNVSRRSSCAMWCG